MSAHFHVVPLVSITDVCIFAHLSLLQMVWLQPLSSNSELSSSTSPTAVVSHGWGFLFLNFGAG